MSMGPGGRPSGTGPARTASPRSPTARGGPAGLSLGVAAMGRAHPLVIRGRTTRESVRFHEELEESGSDRYRIPTGMRRTVRHCHLNAAPLSTGPARPWRRNHHRAKSDSERGRRWMGENLDGREFSGVVACGPEALSVVVDRVHPRVREPQHLEDSVERGGNPPDRGVRLCLRHDAGFRADQVPRSRTRAAIGPRAPTRPSTP